MNEKARPSKIPTTGKNTNKKKYSGATMAKFDKAFFKKNEFALILFGALLLTVMIFFLFFRSSEKPSQTSMATDKASSSFAELEKRVEQLEETMAAPKKDGQEPAVNPKAANLVELTNRVTRLETAFQVKFDSMMEKMGALEKKVAAQVQAAKPVAVKKPQSTAVKKKTAAVKPPVKKAVKKEKKESIFHTVTKGETLYSISKKYKTTVSELRKLNNLSEKDKIYPGNNIIVR